MKTQQSGISGFAVYTPPYRVSLESWCEWTGNDWSKISNVVGHSFRMRGPDQNVYTMAANAVLRLIDQYRVDPDRVGFLGLGTESSMDNSAGAVIVKGMVNNALRMRGAAPLSRACEVPEFKHACLGGVYAMKNALRYLACDDSDRLAIIVNSDIAEYARGSSGEPTQGAGAVAMLLEKDPRLLHVDLSHSGSASDYRGVDFRKPMTRFCGQTPRLNGQLQDLPVFNGKYSTTCYIDETLQALDDMFHKRGGQRAEYLRTLAAGFMHRPYRRMPESAWALFYLFSLAAGPRPDLDELSGYAEMAEVEFDALCREMRSAPDLLTLVGKGNISDDAYPLSMSLLRPFRRSEAYRRLVDDKLAIGSALMMELGNIYTGALHGWLAAGLEEAVEKNLPWAGAELLTVGYGSGDAAEAIPMRVCDDWQAAARTIGFRASLDDAIDLTREQYECLHDQGDAQGLDHGSNDTFVLDRVGDSATEGFSDEGIEYYEYVPGDVTRALRVAR